MYSPGRLRSFYFTLTTLMIFWLGAESLSLRQCPKFMSHGCFHARVGSFNLLPDLILTDRDPDLAVFSGKRVDWKNWDDYLPDLICRCARRAKELGNTYFAIQFYGECWSGRPITDSPKEEFKSLSWLPSNKCFGRGYRTCAKHEKYCVGGANTEMIFILDDTIGLVDYCAEEPCLNGGTCTNGIQSRTCKCPLGYSGKSCEVVPRCMKVRPLGCYRDQWRGKPTTKLILTDRDLTSVVSTGKHEPDWDNWGHYLPDIACRCAAKAKKMGIKIIGIQYYGECWGSSSSKPEDFNPSAQVDNCAGIDFKTCGANEDYCVGLRWSNYVYELVDDPLVDDEHI